MWAGTAAHNDIVGVGREGDWNSHTIEHELSGLYDCAHGVDCCNNALMDGICL